ncbi:hypothetical protein Syun_018102 [Stephania yunnanensis]|uniref:Uncharacterized protein n=1 Tax=Stephania yunnanensis TaxID=152371 RepID=A0AAP0ISA3_9MAGN
MSFNFEDPEDAAFWDEEVVKFIDQLVEATSSSANPTQPHLHRRQIFIEPNPRQRQEEEGGGDETDHHHQRSRLEPQIVSNSSANPPQLLHRVDHHHQSRFEPQIVPDSSAAEPHSPPRDLFSEKTVEQSGDYEAAIERLKSELWRKSEEEKEYGGLQRDRDKKNEQLKSAISQINAGGTREPYEADFQDLFQPASSSIDQKKSKHRNSKRRGKVMNVFGENSINVQTDTSSLTTDVRRRVLIDGDLSTSNEGSTQEAVLPEARRQPGSSSKAIGIQTDVYDEFSYFSSSCSLSNKLHVIWGSHSRLSGRDLVSKLFVSCTTDFHVLSRCISMNMPSQISLNSLTDGSLYSIASHNHSVEASKVSHLFFILTKMSNGMVQLNILLDALLDLCALPNVVVSHTSLRIVHAIVLYVLSLDIGPDRRPGDLMHVSAVNWVAFFETLHRIAVEKKEESLREEALSIMNLIVMKSNPLTEREQFGSFLLFESVSQLFQNTGLRVKSQAVRLLFLLLNCPKLLMKLCSSGEHSIESAGSDVEGKRSAATLQPFSRALDGLAECLNCSGLGAQFTGIRPQSYLTVPSSLDYGLTELCTLKYSALALLSLVVLNSSIGRGYKMGFKIGKHGKQYKASKLVFPTPLFSIFYYLKSCSASLFELKLCRRVIILLAFIASSGKSGFEILLTPRTPKFLSFLGLIMQVLSSEMDAEPTGPSELSEMLKERTSMIREALILLNRLISSPIYSAAALGALTSSRDMTSLTLDVANTVSRLGRKWKCNQAKNRKINSDIDDLARVFRSRVFTFLGAAIS